MAGLGPEFRSNAELPGSTQGGVIESVKRAVMVALKSALVGTSLGSQVSGSKVVVDMEYPTAEEQYPGIWVQFSFTEFMNSGLGMEMPYKDPDTDTWVVLKEFQFKGNVTLTIVALTNLERDRLADSVATMLMFARAPEYVITDPNRDTKQFRSLITEMSNNPYVAMTINTDTITPGGQSVSPGVPWDDEIPGYEDNYSFSILGQSNIVFRNDGTYTLRAITTTEHLEGTPPSPFDWQ